MANAVYGDRKEMNTSKLMENRQYVVRYRDSQSKFHEFSTQARDSYEARLVAIENVDFIHQHPNSIDCITLEKSN